MLYIHLPHTLCLFYFSVIPKNMINIGDLKCPVMEVLDVIELLTV